MRQEVLRNNTDVVSALRQGLAASIGRERYELWFGTSVRLEAAGDAIVVSAPDPFTLERVRRQFSRELHKVAAVVSPEPPRVEFRVQDAAESETTSLPASHPANRHCDSQSVRDVACRGDAGHRSVGRQILPAAESRSLAAAKVTTVKSASNSAADQRTGRRFANFESFVIGTGNKIAVTAAQSVANQPGTVSPLLIYGPSGSGKTHLLESIWTTARATHKLSRVLYLSAEQFTSFFLEALQGSGLPSFRRRVRDVDLLLVDDIQFFSGKRATLVEFQHTLDALIRNGRQLVVASDRAPAELTCLSPEIAARLTGGLVCSIDLADLETRRKMARQFVTHQGMKLNDEIADLIALETNGDARQIQGALNRLRAHSLALNEPITLELAKNSLSDLFAAAQRIVRLPDIEKAVCEVFGLEAKSLRDSGKAKATSQPRMLAMWLARKYTRMAFSEISEYFGRRSHTTVMSAEQKVNQWVSSGAKLRLGANSWSADEAIRRLENKLRSG